MDSLVIQKNPRQDYQPLALLLLVTSGGILFDCRTSFELEIELALGSTALMGWLLLRRKTHRTVLSVLLLIVAFWLGASWHHLYWRSYLPTEIGCFATKHPTPAAIEATLVRSPDWIPESCGNSMDRQVVGERMRMVVQVAHIRDRLGYRRATGRLLVTVNGIPKNVSVGQKLHFFGLLSRPHLPRSPGEFNASRFFRSQRVNAQLFVAHPEAVSETRVSDSDHAKTRVNYVAGWIWIDWVRSHFHNTIVQTMDPDCSALQSAILLGMRTLISDQQNETFLKTGTMHLLAISGLHVGILCSGLFALLRIGLFPPKRVLIAIICLVVFYCLLTQLRPPVVRASILITFYCFSKLIYRDPQPIGVLSLAGLVILVMNPTSIFQVGTQLSFIAVATLIRIQESQGILLLKEDSLHRWLKRKRSRWQRLRDSVWSWINGALITSLSVFLVTLPLVAHHFHVVAPIGVLCNLTLMIPVWLTLQFGFLLLVFGNVPVLNQWLGHACDDCIRLIQWQVGVAVEIPVGHWWSFGFGSFWIGLFYLGLALAFFKFNFRIHWTRRFMLIVFWLASALVVPEIRNQYFVRDLRVTFIDVQHGCSILIECPNGPNLLYDAGSLNSSQHAIRRISNLLWSRRIYHLDTVILSHADLDHYNAVPELTRRFKVGQILVSPLMFDQDSSQPLRELQRSAAAGRIPIKSVSAGSNFDVQGRLQGSFLHPAQGFESSTDNGNSLVLLLNFCGYRLLLTGDLEADGQNHLMSQLPVDCDILLAPHHGSRSSDHAGMSVWSAPEYVVISCGSGKLSTTVVDDYRVRRASVYQTATSGTIQFAIGKKGITVTPFLR